MKSWKIYGLLLFLFSALSLHAAPFYLGTASTYSVLGDSTVTNTGPTTISGDLGLYPGTSITGFFGTTANEGPGVVGGAVHQTDAAAQQALIDAGVAYTTLAAMPFTQDLTGQGLGGLSLTPGVYRFRSDADLAGTLTLDPLGDPNALFVFQIGSTLTAETGSSVVTKNNANCCNVYWLIGSSATLKTTTHFLGTILASESITLNTDASIIRGRAIALNAAVTLDTNTITNPVCDIPAAVPEPGTVSLLGGGLFGLILLGRRARKRAA